MKTVLCIASLALIWALDYWLWRTFPSFRLIVALAFIGLISMYIYIAFTGYRR
jgi:hypothetical protein